MLLNNKKEQTTNRHKTEMSFNNILLSKRRQHKRVYTAKTGKTILQIMKLKNWLSRTGWE